MNDSFIDITIYHIEALYALYAGLEPATPDRQSSEIPIHQQSLSLAEDDSIELLTRQRYHGFQDRLRSQPRHLPYSVAVGPGFEPGVRLSAYERLAIFWFKPLTHPTVYFGRRCWNRTNSCCGVNAMPSHLANLPIVYGGPWRYRPASFCFRQMCYLLLLMALIFGIGVRPRSGNSGFGDPHFAHLNYPDRM